MTEPEPQDGGIGGWLMLLGAGVSLAPVNFLRTIFGDVAALRDGSMHKFTDPAGSDYHPLWQAIVSFRFLANGTLLVAHVVLAVLFFNCSRHFPRLFVFLALALLATVLIDEWLVSAATWSPFSLDLKALAPTAAALGVWTPYLLRSQRSKITFVR